jgi:sterol desaturase/sphingolipid hydroxylase (fatty acid hydroxylase superfamily)
MIPVKNERSIFMLELLYASIVSPVCGYLLVRLETEITKRRNLKYPDRKRQSIFAKPESVGQLMSAFFGSLIPAVILLILAVWLLMAKPSVMLEITQGFNLGYFAAMFSLMFFVSASTAFLQAITFSDVVKENEDGNIGKKG